MLLACVMLANPAPTIAEFEFFFLDLWAGLFSPQMFGVVWDYYNWKLKGKQYKQKTSPKICKTEIKILANPGLA